MEPVDAQARRRKKTDLDLALALYGHAQRLRQGAVDEGRWAVQSMKGGTASAAIRTRTIAPASAVSRSRTVPFQTSPRPLGPLPGGYSMKGQGPREGRFARIQRRFGAVSIRSRGAGDAIRERDRRGSRPLPGRACGSGSGSAPRAAPRGTTVGGAGGWAFWLRWMFMLVVLYWLVMSCWIERLLLMVDMFWLAAFGLPAGLREGGGGDHRQRDGGESDPGQRHRTSP